jgi:hypothetical protein
VDHGIQPGLQYFKKLTDSMPERIKLVLEHRGEMAKY